MSKIVRRFPIDDFWNIGKTESWFSDMASGGLHLKKFGRTFVYFEKGEISDTNYRIDVLYDMPSGEQLDVYKEYGWHFVAKTGFFYVFSSPKDSNAPELHTDTVEQSYTLNELNRILKRNIIVSVVSTLFVTIITLALTFYDNEPYLNLVKGRFVFLYFQLIVYLYLPYSTVRNYLYVKKVKESLINGIEIDHNEDWKKGRLVNKIVNTVTIIIASIIVFIPYVQMVKSNEYTLPEIKVDLPIIRLADIEENSNLQRNVYYNDEEDIDYNNNVRYDWSPLAPTMYEIRESGTVEGMIWSDNSGEYSPSIHTEYYQLALEDMANGVLRDLMHKELYDPRYKTEKIDNPNFDQLYIVKKDTSDATKLIFVSLDNNVIYIRYHGNEDVEKIVDLLEDMEI